MWGLRICISIKLSGDADAAAWGPRLENHCFGKYLKIAKASGSLLRLDLGICSTQIPVRDVGLVPEIPAWLLRSRN